MAKSTKHTRTLSEDALAHAAGRLTQSHALTSLTYDDHFQGHHLALTSQHPTQGWCEWQLHCLDVGARLLLFSESPRAAAATHEALADFESDTSWWKRERRKLRRRMRKMARDLALAWDHGMRSAGEPLTAAFSQLQTLFPTARLVVGVSRRFNTRHKDHDARKIHISTPQKSRWMAMRFAAMIPIAKDTWRAAPFESARGIFVVHGLSHDALNTTAQRAGVLLQDTRAVSLQNKTDYGQNRTDTSPSTVDDVDTLIHDDAAGFCVEVGCDWMPDMGFAGCEILGGCDGVDGCGSCDL